MAALDHIVPDDAPSTADVRDDGRVMPPARDEISKYHLCDEPRLVGGLIERAIYTEDERRRTQAVAKRLVESTRGVAHGGGAGIDAFMREYGLSTEEGVILLCLAEALLRIPDQETADAFLADKLAGGDWRSHLGHSDSMFVNASTWGLLLSGRVMKLKQRVGDDPLAAVSRLVARSGEAVVRGAVRRAVKLLGEQYVMGRDIDAAVARARSYQAKGYRISYDMLGEEAVTQAGASLYYARYMAALDAIADDCGPFSMPFADALMARPSLSIKLSALHPRFEMGREARLQSELVPRVLELTRKARRLGLTVTIDAEEQDRLDITLDVFNAVFSDPDLAHWNGLGIAVQAYGKRAVPVLRWLRRLALDHGKRIPLRLVKGAYWDSEIKLAQEQGLKDYPVLTRKLHTDVSYLACMRFLFSDATAFYPQFATHNAHTVAAAMTAAGNTDFEYQRLHGMGEALYDNVVGQDGLGRACRIYAPVGTHEVLLSYLVRRLLENGANTSFVNRLADLETPVSSMVQDPVQRLEDERSAATPVKNLVRPRDVFWPERKNASGLSFADPEHRDKLRTELEAAIAEPFDIGPIIAGEQKCDAVAATWMLCPHDRGQRLGSLRTATRDDIDDAVTAANKAAHDWDKRGGTERAKHLQLAADIFERDCTQLMAVVVRETGMTIPSALAEVRQAADFLRYYAVQGRQHFTEPRNLRSTTGETNKLRIRGRGVFACISPWSSPLAIFTGQIAAALAAGNSVLAKPAPQTPLSSYLAVKILHEAGVPATVLHFLPGGADVATALVQDARVAGVALTGRTKTASLIHKKLAERRGTIPAFIAASGSLNAVISDSSALAEHLVRDIVQSAFADAGQNCAAARLLFVQDDTAERAIDMLVGATQELAIGDPMAFETDIGPVIDHAAQDFLDAHKLHIRQRGSELIDRTVAPELRFGSYVAPAIYELPSLEAVRDEVFGPVLHVVRYERGYLDRVVDEINQLSFGLTLSVHSRIGAVAEFVENRARVGNLCINRQQGRAVPGVHPFGGIGLSGHGPKAGGPSYVTQFGQERTRTDNITATGGNIRLLAHDMSEPD